MKPGSLVDAPVQAVRSIAQAPRIAAIRMNYVPMMMKAIRRLQDIANSQNCMCQAITVA